MLSVLVTETVINEVGKHNLFNQLRNRLHEKKIDFKIITFKSLEKNKVYSYRGLKVQVIKTKKYKLKILNLLTIFFALIKLKPDHVTIGGYGYMQNWIALFYALVFKKKRTLWTGASIISSLNYNYSFFFLKSIFIKQFDNAIVYGNQSKKFLIRLGFKKKIFLTYNISDVEFFSKKKKYLKDKKFKIPRFIFCARLVKHKGIEYLLKTFEMLDKNKYHLTIVGDGPLKKLIIPRIISRKINGRYLGKIPQNKLSQVFNKSDYYISTTYNDPFSRVLSEAISSGCYSISSKFDDASYDLIKRNNGIVYDPSKRMSLFNIINKIINDQKLKSIQLTKNKIKLNNFNTNKYSNIYSNSIIELLHE